MNDGFVKIGVSSVGLRVGAVEENCTSMINEARLAEKSGVKILVFPELSLCGATAGDFLFNESLIKAVEDSLIRFANETAELDLVCFVGAPVSYLDKLYNSSVAVCGGEILGIYTKRILSAAEKRWFVQGPEATVDVCLGNTYVPFGSSLIFESETVKSLRIACEIGSELGAVVPPSSLHASMGATLIINPSATPETALSSERRRMLVASQSLRALCAYVHAGAGEGESGTDALYSSHSIIASLGETVKETESFEGRVYATVDMSLVSSRRRADSDFVTERDELYDYIPFKISTTVTEIDGEITRFPFVPGTGLSEYCAEILEIQSRALALRLQRSYSKKLVIGVSGGLDSTLAMLVCARAADIAKMPRDTVLAVTMPCFGTTKRTRSNAEILSERLGAEFRTVDISESARVHLSDIGHDGVTTDVTYENAQARERTQVLMDIANSVSGLVVGTGDLSELVLGWATYNGDHMSMYGVNSSIPKTLIRHVVEYYREREETSGDKELARVLCDILATPVSPELIPPSEGEITQRTEDIVGPYELHDFFIYHTLVNGFGPKKVLRLALSAFKDVYTRECIVGWMKVFFRRLVNQQFKRSCQPDGVKTGVLSVSPRGALVMPSDASVSAFSREIEELL